MSERLLPNRRAPRPSILISARFLAIASAIALIVSTMGLGCSSASPSTDASSDESQSSASLAPAVGADASEGDDEAGWVDPEIGDLLADQSIEGEVVEPDDGSTLEDPEDDGDALNDAGIGMSRLMAARPLCASVVSYRVVRDNADAQTRCRDACGRQGRRFDGQWWQQGRGAGVKSICQCCQQPHSAIGARRGRRLGSWASYDWTSNLRHVTDGHFAGGRNIAGKSVFVNIAGTTALQVLQHFWNTSDFTTQIQQNGRYVYVVNWHQVVTGYSASGGTAYHKVKYVFEVLHGVEKLITAYPVGN